MSAESFQRRLEELVGAPLILRLNCNTSQVLSVKTPAGSSLPIVSVHRAFLQADDKVLRAVAQFIRQPTPHCRRVLRQFIASIPHEEFRQPARQTLRLCSRGRYYDLDQILRDLINTFFSAELSVAITWGRNGKPLCRRRRHIQLGSYNHHQRVIRIHPMLDSPHVPEYFVRFVVYHELLHAKLDSQRDASGRRQLHTRTFRLLERRFPHYKEAVAFEREFLKSI
ncbi:MAG: hypothetical protein N2Z21_01430 [Candidatus Sumerlaeaceae bacterium]|nr:hypothetical protein [Candidatus Sumerlaeaceae bacterium]